MKRKLISVVLCVLLLVGTMSLAANAAKARHYLVLGDSIAFGSGLVNPRKAVYGKIVADTNGYTYENHAIPGMTTTDLLLQIKEKPIRKSICKADIINISIGGNNFLRSDLSALLYDSIVRENYSRLDKIAAGFYKDLGKIVDAIRALNPKAAIVLQTIYNPQRSEAGKVYLQGGSRLNTKMQKYAKEHPGQILIADVAKALTDKKHDFAEDGIHPSASGNVKIARVILQTLYDNGLGEKTEPVVTVKGLDIHGNRVIYYAIFLYAKLFRKIADLQKSISAHI